MEVVKQTKKKKQLDWCYSSTAKYLFSAQKFLSSIPHSKWQSLRYSAEDTHLCVKVKGKGKAVIVRRQREECGLYGSGPFETPRMLHFLAWMLDISQVTLHC